MQSSPEARAALWASAPLARLGDADCDALLKFMRSRALAAGQALFQQGDAGDTLVLVADGLLSVQVARKGAAAIEVARIGRGEIVGESACLDPAPRSATVTALMPATVYELSREAMTALRRHLPAVASTLIGAILGDVTRRLRQVDERIEREIGRAASVPASVAPASGAISVPSSMPPTSVRGSRPSIPPAPSGSTPAARSPIRTSAPAEPSRSSFWGLIDRLRGDG